VAVTTVDVSSRWRFVRHSPLVPAAVLFLLGVTAGPWFAPASGLFLSLSILAWALWLLAEQRPKFHALPAIIMLSFALWGSGVTTWQLNQNYGASEDIVRFAPDDGEVPLTLRARVIVPPASGEHHGNAYFTAEAAAIFADDRWLPASGNVSVKCHLHLSSPALATGDQVEICGWLSRPALPLNPGTLNMRERLAADRIFVAVRVPRASGITRLSKGDGSRIPLLTRLRLDLRAKLLAHTLPADPDAANTLVAVVLGYRDPSMDDISRAFSNAGVGHLLAISGSHVAFFAGAVWLLLRFIPVRPRWREPIAAAIVFGYVAATPCGPPVLRAAIAVGMVLVSRILGRPRAYMNMLAAAAVIIVLLRPMDLRDAGFQLTFLCTAALFLLMKRIHVGLFAGILARQQLLAELGQRRWTRFRFQMLRFVTLALVANAIGATTSTPLVMHHFNQLYPAAIVSGMIVFPFVALTMMAGVIQLALESLSITAGTLFAPLSTHIAQFTVWLIEKLAAIPGMSIAVRSPPPWLVVILFAPLILWAARRWLNLQRALIFNTTLAALCCTVAWYTSTTPRGSLRLQILSVGQGSCIVMTSPQGQTWVLNAGSRDQPNPMATALAPTLRVAGAATLDGLLLSSVDSVHASIAGDIVHRFHPRTVITCGSVDSAGWTFAADQLTTALEATHTYAETVHAGDQVLRLMHVLGTDSSLAVMMQFAGRRVLLLDSSSVPALTLLPLNGIDLRCDAVIILSPERGAADDEMRQLMGETQATMRIWSGRGPWAPKNEGGGVWTAADGWVDLEIDGSGRICVTHNGQTVSNGS
jgi:competence protein ComEC